MNGLTLLSTGSCAGSRVVTNDDFAKVLDTSDEWIYSRTGIHERHFCSEEESCVSLAREASKKALERAGLRPEDIDCCIAATVSGDYTSPGVACSLQRDLGLREDIPVLDVNAACSGFLYGMETARGFLESGKATRARAGKKARRQKPAHYDGWESRFSFCSGGSPQNAACASCRERAYAFGGGPCGLPPGEQQNH